MSESLESRALRVVPGPGRVPPQNLDAERSLLGGILLDNKALDEVVAIVWPTDFYRDAHRKVFEAMQALDAKSEPIDRVTLKRELELEGAFEAVGGEDFVDLLDKLVPSAANLVYYARIVADKALARRVIEAAHAIVTEGYEQAGDVSEFVDCAESRIFSLRSERLQHELATMRESLPPVFKTLEARYERNEDVTGAPSGIEKLDRLTHGFQPGDLVILAARPSMGKTAFALDIARATARPAEEKPGGAVAVFSREMPKEALVERLLSAEARVNSDHLRTGRLNDGEWGRLAKAASTLADLPLHINDTARTVMEIRAVSRRAASRLATTSTPLRLIVIDYLQLLEFEGGDDVENRERQIASVSRQLKGLAKMLRVPVVALSQLNRNLEKRPDKRPMPADLRESGALEQDSDTIIFLYRDEVYDKDSSDKGVAEIIVSKQRNGPIGTVRAAFLKEFTTFENLYDGPQQMGFSEAPPPESENP